MTNVKQAVPLFMVKDISMSIDFYVNGLGFEMRNSWAPGGKLRWCLLGIDEVALMLQEFTAEKQAPHASRVNAAEGVEIFLICEDALKIYDKIKKNGILPSEPFVGNTMWVVSLRDPDGYKLSFESPLN